MFLINWCKQTSFQPPPKDAMDSLTRFRHNQFSHAMIDDLWGRWFIWIWIYMNRHALFETSNGIYKDNRMLIEQKPCMTYTMTSKALFEFELNSNWIYKDIRISYWAEALYDLYMVRYLWCSFSRNNQQPSPIVT